METGSRPIYQKNQAHDGQSDPKIITIDLPHNTLNRRNHEILSDNQNVSGRKPTMLLKRCLHRAGNAARVDTHTRHSTVRGLASTTPGSRAPTWVSNPRSEYKMPRCCRNATRPWRMARGNDQYSGHFSSPCSHYPARRCSLIRAVRTSVRVKKAREIRRRGACGGRWRCIGLGFTDLAWCILRKCDAPVNSSFVYRAVHKPRPLSNKLRFWSNFDSLSDFAAI